MTWIFGERSFNHLLVQSVLNGAAVLILLSPLVGFGLSTGPARNALCSFVDWLLEEEVSRVRTYVQKVEEEEGLLWRFLEEEAGQSSREAPRRDKRLKELGLQSKEGRLREMDVQGYRRAVLFLQSRWRQDESLSKSEPCAERQGEGEEEV